MGAPGSIGPVIILFDGVCNLCNGLVQFVIKRDPHASFRFASLQSEAGKNLLRQYNLNPDSLHSIVVIDNAQAFERSEAAFRIVQRLGGPWKLLGAFKVLPKFICDAFYNVIASNRYRLFGKQESCMIPTPELKQRFL